MALLDLVQRQKAGHAVGITSVCSSHPLVIEAAVIHAAQSGGTALIEATSNQVDQTGGYSGLRPRDFRELVLSTAGRLGLPAERVVLGGDHLGPNRWRRLAPEEAMGHAEELIEAYVGAGFTKIHLDCSFPCAGDRAPLTDEIVSARTARLLGVAETAAARAGRAREPVYVIGTEVPLPGGERDAAAEMAITTSSAARATLRCHREAFGAHGLDDTWPRVIALVVQPGVDFDHLHVAEYRRGRAAALRHVLDDERHMVFEAHSTDYQPLASLRALVEDHWAILKVGPALTFALREAMFALAAIERELVALGQQSGLLDVIEERMLAEPMWWEEYYGGDERRRRFARRFSYSDRVRYYWADPAVSAAQERLLDNLDHVGLPLPLLSQYLPRQYARVRDEGLAPTPRALIVDRVRDVLRDYTRACTAFAAPDY